MLNVEATVPRSTSEGSRTCHGECGRRKRPSTNLGVLSTSCLTSSIVEVSGSRWASVVEKGRDKSLWREGDVCRRRGKQRQTSKVGWMPKLSQHAHAPMNLLSRACKSPLIHKTSSRNFHSTVRMQGDYNVFTKGCSFSNDPLTNHDRQP